MDYFYIVKGLIAEFPVNVLKVNHYAPNRVHIALIETSYLSEDQQKSIKKVIRKFFRLMVDSDIIVGIKIQELSPLW